MAAMEVGMDLYVWHVPTYCVGRYPRYARVSAQVSSHLAVERYVETLDRCWETPVGQIHSAHPNAALVFEL